MKKMVSQKVLTGLLVVSLVLLVISTLLTFSVVSQVSVTKEKTLIIDESDSKQQASVGIIIAPSAPTENASETAGEGE